MRRHCPNLEREEGLETVLEVPIPEEMFKRLGNNVEARWQNMLTWMKAQSSGKLTTPLIASRYNDLGFLLSVVGAPLLPLPVPLLPPPPYLNHPLRLSTIESSTAFYILHQYVAAVGGHPALNSLRSLCAVGRVSVSASDFQTGDRPPKPRGPEEVGSFVAWHKNPDLWSLELVISGCKLASGCDGHVSWRQSSSMHSHIVTGPPRLLRRFLQGLDPRATSCLFQDAVCIGEKTINNDDCFILKLDTASSVLERQGGPNFDIIRHTFWGYFSQRSGLLVQLEDSRLLGMMTKPGAHVFWETSSESVIEDYRYVDGVNVAHAGRTVVTIFRYGEQSENHKREMEEKWRIEEVGFNVSGLTSECFLPPSDIRDLAPRLQKQYSPSSTPSLKDGLM